MQHEFRIQGLRGLRLRVLMCRAYGLRSKGLGGVQGLSGFGNASRV